MTLEGHSPNDDLDIRVTLALHHAPHEVILGYQILSFQKVDPQHPLQAKKL